MSLVYVDPKAKCCIHDGDSFVCCDGKGNHLSICEICDYVTQGPYPADGCPGKCAFFRGEVTIKKKKGCDPKAFLKRTPK